MKQLDLHLAVYNKADPRMDSARLTNFPGNKNDIAPQQVALFQQRKTTQSWLARTELSVRFEPPHRNRSVTCGGAMVYFQRSPGHTSMILEETDLRHQAIRFLHMFTTASGYSQLKIAERTLLIGTFLRELRDGLG